MYPNKPKAEFIGPGQLASDYSDMPSCNLGEIKLNNYIEERVKMEKFKSMITLVGPKGIIGIYKDIEELKEQLKIDIEKGLSIKDLGDDIRILNTLHHVHQGYGFELEIEYAMPSLSIEDNKCFEDAKLRIKNGKFRGEVFPDESELESFLREEWHGGNLDLEDLRDIDIEIVENHTVNFIDAIDVRDEADLEIEDIDIKFTDGINPAIFGKEFALVNELMNAQPTPDQTLIPTSEYQELLAIKGAYEDTKDERDFLKREKDKLETTVFEMDQALSIGHPTTGSPSFIMNTLNKLDPDTLTELEIRQLLNTFNTLGSTFYKVLQDKFK